MSYSYFVVAEALTNIVKHARASRARVTWPGTRTCWSSRSPTTVWGEQIRAVAPV
jgi:hypothetical protein